MERAFVEVVSGSTPRGRGEPARGYPSPRGGTRVSWSRVDTYSTCGEKFRLRYLEKAPQRPSGALIGGNAVHEAAAAALTEGWWDSGDADAAHEHFLAVFTNGVEEAGGPSAVQWFGRKDSQGRPSEDFTWWKQAGRGMLLQAREIAVADASAGLTLLVDGGVELELRIETPSGSRFLSYLDLAQLDSEGRVVVSDYKTGKVGNSPLMQLPTYAWAIREARGLDCHSARFLYLRGSLQTRVKQIEVAPFIPLVERMMDDFERGVEAGLFPHKPSMLCGYCDVAEFCQYGAALQGRQRLMIGGPMDTQDETSMVPFDAEEISPAMTAFDPEADAGVAESRGVATQGANAEPLAEVETGSRPEPAHAKTAIAKVIELPVPSGSEFDAKNTDLETVAKGLAVTDDASYSRAGELRTAANMLCTEIRDFFKPLKKKLDEAKQVMLDAEREKLEVPQKVIALLDGRMLAHAAEIERRRKAAAEEQRRLEREAEEERQRREQAAQALREAGETEAAEKVEAVPAPVVSNVIPMPEMPKAAGMKAPTTTYSAKLTDIVALVKAAAAGDPLAMSMIAFDQTAANASARKLKDAFRDKVPGVELVTDRKMSGRAR